MHRLILTLSLIVLISNAVLASELRFDDTPRENDPQRLVIPRTTEAPVIDGDLSDKAWEHATQVKAFWLGGTDRTAENQTLAWLTFDADHLYIAYAAQDRNVQTGRYPHDDRQVWMHDGVEVHLSPTRDPDAIYQFIVGASGSTYDRSTVERSGQEQVAWNPPAPWQSAVKIQPFGYTVEICIPFAAVLDRAKYDVDRGSWWRIKLTRLDFGGTNEYDLSSWTRIGTNTSDQFSLGDLYFESRNLLDNGSAEVADDKGAPAGWESPHHGMTMTATTSEGDATDGSRTARYEIRGQPRGGINSRIYPGKMARHRAPIETTYRFTADVRAQCEPGGMVSYFVVFNGSENSKVMYQLDGSWQHVQAMVTVEAGKTTTIPAIQSVPTNQLNNAELPGGVIELDNVKFEAVEPSDLTGDPDAVCLTGNAFGAQRTRNAQVEGAYTYFEPGTEGAHFPNYWRGEKPPEMLEYAGWIPFLNGLLTDGLTSTGVQWGNFWVGAEGNDIALDLKKDYIITRVVVLGREVGTSQVFTKAQDDSRYALVASTFTQFDWDTGRRFEGSDTECVMNVPSQPARWVRVQIRRKGSNPCEVQIWGKPAEGGSVTRLPLLQNEGKSPIDQPRSQPVVYRDIPPIFPTPQECVLEGPALPLRDGMRIAWATAGGERANVTAQVLAEELKTCFGLTVDVVQGDRGDITLGEGSTAPDKPDGYLLVNDGQRVRVTGHDPRGTFYGVQALLSLVRRSSGDGWEIPGATVRDWPDMTVRFIQGRPIPDKGLIRALARFRITHYEPQARYLNQAAQWDKEAQRYFVQFVPELAFNRIVLGVDPTLVERAADTTLESLGHARRNANPAAQRSWEIYLAEVEKWLPKFHGDMVHINYDETYQESGGARWNVSPESRALGLSAGELIAYQLNRINEAFKKHGKSILMHDTAFMGHHTLSYAGDPNPDWLAALPKLPKDVRFLIWHPEDAEPILHEAGFELYELILDEVDWRKSKLPGRYAGITAFMAESAFTPAKLINLAGVAWNLKAPRPQDPRANNVTTSYVKVWQELHTDEAKPSRYATSQDYTPIDISSAANRSRVDEIAYDGKGFVDMGANVDLRALPKGTQSFAGIPFDIINESANNGSSIVMIHNKGDANRILPSEVVIDTKDFQASSLMFLHCLEHRPGHNYLRRKELAGFYIVEYDDGTYARCEIKYAVNIANWSGRPTNSGYNPKGHVMTDGFLAWEGQTTSGMPAFLYAMEWVNPCPRKTIVRIRLRGNDRLGHMNPMLFAVTALSPRLASADSSAPQMPAIHRLDPPRTIGTPLDLAGGIDHTDRRYLAPDGTVIQVPNMYNDNADHIRWDILDYRSKVGMIHEPGNYAMVRSPVVEYVFPKPTRIAGALVTGGYRLERKTEDFDPAIQNLELLVSFDEGQTWVSQSRAAEVSPEEHGPQWLGVQTDQPITHLRVTSQTVSGFTYGIERIVLFQP